MVGGDRKSKKPMVNRVKAEISQKNRQDFTDIVIQLVFTAALNY